eukprot:7526193-Pyramimonas_sp.AAC.1
MVPEDGHKHSDHMFPCPNTAINYACALTSFLQACYVVDTNQDVDAHAHQRAPMHALWHMLGKCAWSGTTWKRISGASNTP